MTLRYRISIRRHVSPGSCCSLRGAGARAEPFRAAAERTRRGAVAIRFNQRYSILMYIDVYEWRYPFSIIIPLKKLVLQHLWGKKSHEQKSFISLRPLGYMDN